MEPHIVPVEFWYASTLLLAGVLVWIIQKYFASLTESIKSIKESINKLTDLVNLHDYQINELKGNVRKSVKR